MKVLGGHTFTEADKAKLDAVGTTISTDQANAIIANTAKTGISTSQANAITANTAKVDLTVDGAGTVHANNYTDTNTTYTAFDNDNAGLVPDPGSTGTTTKFLREDGSFQVPAYIADTNTQLPLIDSDTMSGALSTNVASAESVKAYVDTRYSYQYIHFFSISDNNDDWAIPHANGWVAYNNKWNTDLATNTTTIGDTATIARAQAMSGFIVPHDDCVLVGFYAMVRNNDADNQSHVGLFHNTYAEVGAKSGNTSTWALRAYAAADKTGYSDTPSTAGGNSYTGPCKAIDMGRSLSLNAGDMIVPAVMEETANKIYFNITMVIKTPIF